jgi:hypothetical protein
MEKSRTLLQRSTSLHSGNIDGRIEAGSTRGKPLNFDSGETFVDMIEAQRKNSGRGY